MRNRQEITDHFASAYKEFTSETRSRIQRALLLEVLLDIRDLLKEVVRQQ